MPRYTFTFRKDDMFVEFITTDRDVVERQFQIWVTTADAYIKGTLNFDKPQSQIIEAEENIEFTEEVSENESLEKEEAQVEEQIQPAYQETQLDSVEQFENPQQNSFEGLGQQAEEITQPVYQEFTQEPAAPEYEEIQPKIEEEATKDVFENVSSLLNTINSIQNPPKEEEIKIDMPVFENVLDKSIQNPTFEPNRVRDERFLTLARNIDTSDKFKLFMLTVYYLLEAEKYDRFSLKQVNFKLMNNLSEVLDHSILQDTINQGFVELVPDLTGVAEISEYKLTPIGEHFVRNNL